MSPLMPLNPRLMSGLLAAGVGVGVIRAGGWWFTLLLAVIVHLALVEFFGLARIKGIRAAVKTTLVACHVLLALTQLAAIGEFSAFQTLAAGVLPLAGSIICGWLLLQPITGSIADIAASIFGLFYLGFLPSHWLKLRAVEQFAELGSWAHRYELSSGLMPGLVVTLLALGLILAADIGAYVCGKLFGRAPLSPVSPRKTIEGACGGTAAAAVVGASSAVVVGWPLPLLSGALLGLLVALFALVGDLTESMMKRDAGVKDSGDLIPGHGGILDRVDSYLFTPAVVFYFVAGLLPLIPA